QSAEHNFAHTARQAYIGLGFALAQAAELKVDSTPMEGFDNAKLDELLDLESKGLKSVVLMPLGYRDAEGDWLVNMKKVRKPVDEFVTEIY
ncbi:MAG: nitroreductase family protein, partial [Bacteroidia bacterium]|nr:nitroreductase family protein [Bacteroidia bacterium]